MNCLGDGITVHGPTPERVQDEQVQRALQQVLALSQSMVLPYDNLWGHYILIGTACNQAGDEMTRAEV